MDNHVLIYDTTLRDGAQAEGISFSKIDKVRVAETLDALGVAYVEGGWPGSNPTDMAFFRHMRGRPLKSARLAAFSSTRRADISVEDDAGLRTLLAADTPVTTIVGKSWLLHVHDVLRTTPDENVSMVRDSCAYLKHAGREVIFDAEHFFDSYADDPTYALAVVAAAAEGGASTVVLCDTNGGSLPEDIARICASVHAVLPTDVRLGIHPHNDAGLAVANALAAVNAGATHVQGTINGIGERCGNVDLCSAMPVLELKLGRTCLPQNQLRRITEVSRFVYEHANLRPDPRLPFVGRSAFAHKGGIHVNAVCKNPVTYEHVTPESVGNERRILVSGLAGGSNILMKAAEHDIELDSQGPEVKRILNELKQLESEGYEFEAAGASFELLMNKMLHTHQPFFTLQGFRVIVEKRGHREPCIAEATIKVNVGEEVEITAAEGDGPVNALDKALRKALLRFYPDIANVSLRDYKVRILDADAGTQARTRVLIESSDDCRYWGTVGVSENLIEASWQALVDSVEYALYAAAKANGGLAPPLGGSTSEP